MNTPKSARRSVRSRQSTNYCESPADTPESKKLPRKSLNVIEISDDDCPRSRRRPKKSEVSPDENVDRNNRAKSEAKTLKSRGRPRKSVARDDSPSDDDKNSRAKTPKSSRKSVRKASEEHEDYSPKKLRGVRTPSTRALETIVLENSPTMTKLESPPKRRQSVRERRSVVPTQIEGSVKSAKKTKRTPVDEDESSHDEEENETDLETAQKPTTLFDEDDDVEGQRMYSFKTPKKKDSMAALAQHTPKTPRHHDYSTTPKSKRLSEVQKTPTSRPSAADFAKTPRHVRDAIKKKLVKASYQEDSDGDFSSDASEYEAKEASSSSEEEFSDKESEEDEPPVKKVQTVASRVLKTPSVATSGRRSARNRGDFQYVLQSDDYFSTATTKTKTSDHTLDRLKNPRLPHDQLIKLLSNMELSHEHQRAVKDLNEEHKMNFDKWLTLFDEGYTIMLHGLGSKRNLLQAFHKERLADQHVIVINGFFPSLTIKDILDHILVDILEVSVTAGSPHEMVNAIEEEMKMIPALNLFMIVHNIDGSMLRNDRAQAVLSRLGSIKNLHMIASMDHINAPLLWNNVKLSNYNFVWFDCTSFLPYTEETSFENSLMVQNSGALELSSMKSVFLSLTTNARGIYILIVKHQLNNSRNHNYQGMSFKELYSKCRESFLVSSDVALRAQLTEFLDHKLAKMKRTIEGTENITIPIKNSLLEQFLGDHM